MLDLNKELNCVAGSGVVWQSALNKRLQPLILTISKRLHFFQLPKEALKKMAFLKSSVFRGCSRSEG